MRGPDANRLAAHAVIDHRAFKAKKRDITSPAHRQMPKAGDNDETCARLPGMHEQTNAGSKTVAHEPLVRVLNPQATAASPFANFSKEHVFHIRKIPLPALPPASYN